MAEHPAQTHDSELLQILDEHGVADLKRMPKGLSEKAIKEMYGMMVVARVLDRKMGSLQRQGRLGTFAPVYGHEAVQVASVFAKAREDWLFPYFRQWAMYLAAGMPMEMILQYNRGDERGMLISKNVNAFTPNIPVASQIPHAVGFAWGLQLQKKPGAVLCYLGDGATSKGDFHEGLNFAGVFKVPVVFMCENNQYAISVPRSKQTAATTLAQKACAYGFEGVQVDGNDVFAVYQATKDALEKASKGIPTLIEAVLYRLGDHTTADDALKYRSKKEVEEWMKKDPIDRLRKFLQKEYKWSTKDEEKLQAYAEETVEKAVEMMEKIRPAKPIEMFSYQYAEMTPQLQEQYKDAFGKEEE